MPFYNVDFPKPESIAFTLLWSLVRSSHKGAPTVTKMRIMEKYAQMEINAGTIVGQSDIERAYNIFKTEVTLPVEQQVIGNFLAQLLEEATTYVRENKKTVAPTDNVEDIFKLILGKEPGVPDKMKSEGCVPLFHSMLINTMAHCLERGITLPRNIVVYAEVNNLVVTDVEKVVTQQDQQQQVRIDRTAFLKCFEQMTISATTLAEAANKPDAANNNLKNIDDDYKIKNPPRLEDN